MRHQMPGLSVLVGCFLLQSSVSGQPTYDKFRFEKIAVIDTALSFRGIFSKTENEAWISGTKGAIYRCTDGGEIFTKIEIPNTTESDFRDIHCLGDQSVVAMSVGNGANSRIYKSTDSGRTWKAAFKNPHQDGFLNSIAFWDDRNGIAVGDPVNGHLQILLTTDGGDTWKEVDAKLIPAALPNEHSFAASGTCVAVFGEDHAWIGMGGSAARILKTTNRGKRWQVFETPLLSGQNSTGIFSVYFQSEFKGILVGGDYTKEDLAEKTIALTTDGGETWNGLSADTLPFQSSVSEILVAGSPHLISTGPAGTFFSKDGVLWDRLSMDGYHCMSVSKDRRTAWLAGSAGRVARVSAVDRSHSN